jgi:hypothetical protein
MIATPADPMMKGALLSKREDSQTVVQIEMAASVFGGTVILMYTLCAQLLDKRDEQHTIVLANFGTLVLR